MAENTSPVTTIPEDACWGYLASQEVGRLATAVDNEPGIVPINFVLDGQSVVFRTALGGKLHDLIVNEKVAFEVDGWNDEEGWSVVLHATAEVVEDAATLARFAKAPLRPWVPTVKPIWVRLLPEDLTGRRFRFGPEPGGN